MVKLLMQFSIKCDSNFYDIIRYIPPQTKYNASLSAIKNRLSNLVNNSPDNIREKKYKLLVCMVLSGILKECLSVVILMSAVFQIATFAKHRKGYF